MKNIKLFVRTIGKKESKRFVALINENGIEKEIVKEINETTSGRIIMKGLKEIIDSIKKRSNITVVAPRNFGFRYTKQLMRGKKVSKWTNRDVGILLAESLLRKKHQVRFIDYNKTKISDEMTDEVKCFNDRFKNVIIKQESSIKKRQVMLEEYIIYNKNEIANKEVCLYIRGAANTKQIPSTGKYIAILNFRGKEKEIIKTISNTTSNRLLIQGAIDSIKLLTMPCNIKMYVHAQIGLSTYNKKQKGVNRDLLEELFIVLKDGQHSLEEIVGTYRQNQLAEKLRCKSN